MIFISSFPKFPFSPQCGLNPEIANFGNEYFDESEALPLNFIRFYVGLEDSKFLIKDIEKALN